MSKEGRVIALAILTIFIYAFSILLQKGAFIFPFPLTNASFSFTLEHLCTFFLSPHSIITVLYPEKGVCADPVDKGAILGVGGGKSPSSDGGSQLATDIAGEKT